MHSSSLRDFRVALRAVRYEGGERGGGGGGGRRGSGPSIRPSAHPPEDLSPFPAPPFFFRLFFFPALPPLSPTRRRFPSRGARVKNSAGPPGINNVYKQNHC